MKYDLSKTSVKKDLEWLKTPKNGLNNYTNVVRHLLNEVEELKQLYIPRVSNRREQLIAFAKEMQNIGLNEIDDAEKIVDIWLKSN